MIGYLIALLPLYIFVYLPLSQLLGFSSPFSSSPSSSSSHDPDHAHSFNASFIALEDPDLVCPEHTYQTSILSREPLVLYLENWLSEDEIAHLLEISADSFSPSHVSTGASHFHDPSIRLSSIALLPRTPTVQCIEARALALQGWGRPSPASSPGWSLFNSYSDDAAAPQERDAQGRGDQAQQGGGLLLERLKIQRYGPGGHYAHHYDWQGGAGRVDRVSSFMVYVDANCTGGGTGFPRLARPASRRWCGFIECDDEGKKEPGPGRKEGEGVVFRPKRGNAVYWENLRADGTGYMETWHAGLPVETGVKIGLNIWTWYRF